MENEQEKVNKGYSCSGLCCTKIENFGVTIGSTKILEDINIHIHCGELTAVIGPNGAGKSTLLKAILGDVKHTGRLSFLDEKGMHSGHPVTGYVPQHLSFDANAPVSVLDLFIACNAKAPAWLFGTKKFKKRVRTSLAAANAEHLINKKIGSLSGGELQRVLLALALDPVPDLLLLDEPVSGIDQNGLEIFYNTVSELRKNYDLSIILISHDLDLVEQYADRVILINGTVLCSGSPQTVFNDEKTSKIFGAAWYNSRAACEKNGGVVD